MKFIDLQLELETLNDQYHKLFNWLKVVGTYKILYSRKFDTKILYKFGVVCIAKSIARFAVESGRNKEEVQPMINWANRLIDNEFDDQYKKELKKQIKRNSRQLIKNSKLKEKNRKW